MAWPNDDGLKEGVGMIGLIVAWCFFGLVSALVATSRGGDAVTWFSLGFLLGPFSFVGVFFVGRECPKCKSAVNDRATVCPKCRSEIPRKGAKLSKEVRSYRPDG